MQRAPKSIFHFLIGRCFQQLRVFQQLLEQADGLGVIIAVCQTREEERTGQKRADQREQHVGAAEQEHARIGRAVDLLLLLRSERAREQRVHADCRAGAKGDHQVLQRERQRHGIQCVFTDARDEHAVHHVVERLHQHRDHHRDRHIGQQLADRHRPHLVFRNSFSHILHPELSVAKLHTIQTSIQGADLRVKPCGNEKAPS